MGPPGTDPETMLARTTVVSLALQALVERLLMSGVLTPTDLEQMRLFGLELCADMNAHGSSGAQVGATRLEFEIRAWWTAVGAPDIHANDP